MTTNQVETFYRVELESKKAFEQAELTNLNGNLESNSPNQRFKWVCLKTQTNNPLWIKYSILIKIFLGEFTIIPF